MKYNSTEVKEIGQSLIDFLNSSTCNFVATRTIAEHLEAKGFRKMESNEKWELRYGDKFYVTQNDSSIFAFEIGKKSNAENGFKIITAHSDSPSFRIKPNPEMVTEGGVVKLNTEVYGGPILYTWFDRPLSVSGRVMLRGDNPLHPITKLLLVERPIMVIPHLPIHFNRAVNEGNPLSKQKDMLPVIGAITEEAERGNMLINLISSELGVNKEDIIDFDLTLYPTQKAQFVGIHNEFICSGRIDDLSMAHAGLYAFLNTNNENSINVLAIFDNEETGSGTKQGAASPVLTDILRRIVNNLTRDDKETFYCAANNSFMISADNGHAFHPNYPEKYDPTNHPIIGKGPVIKINANCKYMTDAYSSAVFSELCKKADVPVQYFVNHSDVAGGSTLGNILTSQIAIKGVDVGNPLWAMHSCCETASVADQYYMIQAFKEFYKQ